MIIKINNKPYELATKEEVMKEVIKEMEATKKEVFDKLYPVGSVYISLDATFNPNNIYNGKWELLEKGRYLRATDDANTVGKKVAAGLPNIKGQVSTGGIYGFDAFIAFSGAIKSIDVKQGYRASTLQSTEGTANGLKFDASASSPIYQDGAKVTPESIDAFIWKRVK